MLLVEDNELVRAGVTSTLRSQGHEVRAEIDGSDLAEVLAEFHPALALLDVTLPDGPDGFELASMIRTTSDIPIMFLTASDGIEDRVRGFELGADDYLVKPFSMRELGARVQALLRRAAPSAPEPSSVISVQDLRIDTSQRSVSRAGHPVQLTPTQFDILVSLARRPGEPCPKSQILEEVWGFNDNSRHLVEVQVSSLRRRLEEFGPRLIVTCRDGAYMIQR